MPKSISSLVKSIALICGAVLVSAVGFQAVYALSTDAGGFTTRNTNLNTGFTSLGDTPTVTTDTPTVTTSGPEDNTGKIIFNEFNASFTELVNVSGEAIDVNDWRIVWSAGTYGLTGVMGVGDYYIEGQVDSAELIQLLDENGRLVDSVFYESVQVSESWAYESAVWQCTSVETENLTNVIQDCTADTADDGIDETTVDTTEEPVEETTTTSNTNTTQTETTTTTSTVDPGLTPDSPIYFLDTFAERTRLALTFDADKKAELAAQYAAEKLAEAEAMANEYEDRSIPVDNNEDRSIPVDNTTVEEETIIITEVTPAWIELHNPTKLDIPLQGYGLEVLAGGVSSRFVIASSVPVLKAGEYLVMPGKVSGLTVPRTGALVGLYNPAKQRIDKVAVPKFMSATSFALDIPTSLWDCTSSITRNAKNIMVACVEEVAVDTSTPDEQVELTVPDNQVVLDDQKITATDDNEPLDITEDGLTDAVDMNQDTDEDGLTDAVEEYQGTDPNSDDTDNDGITDDEDATPGTTVAADGDQDGVPNNQEEANGTDPESADTDGDGVEDGVEQNSGTDPLDDTSVASDQVDTDEDGLSDQYEADLGTDPEDPDSDADGLSDGTENISGTDPNNSDTDDDGILDDQDAQPNTTEEQTQLATDTDGDGVSDVDEQQNETDPTAVDSDNDGLSDGVENELGSDPNLVDTDGDGIPDGQDNEPIAEEQAIEEPDAGQPLEAGADAYVNEALDQFQAYLDAIDEVVADLSTDVAVAVAEDLEEQQDILETIQGNVADISVDDAIDQVQEQVNETQDAIVEDIQETDPAAAADLAEQLDQSEDEQVIAEPIVEEDVQPESDVTSVVEEEITSDTSEASSEELEEVNEQVISLGEELDKAVEEIVVLRELVQDLEQKNEDLEKENKDLRDQLLNEGITPEEPVAETEGTTAEGNISTSETTKNESTEVPETEFVEETKACVGNESVRVVLRQLRFVPNELSVTAGTCIVIANEDKPLYVLRINGKSTRVLEPGDEYGYIVNSQVTIESLLNKRVPPLKITLK
ncbi:MAG: DUF5667 domain-containing protein [bacterium]|nr:DUF5667 domain-containing protein [bacterium]